MAVATKQSGNSKTGGMIQTWIVPDDRTVTESRRQGHDAKSQCAGCPLASNKGCYVGSYYVDGVQKSVWAGKKAETSDPKVIADYFRGHKVRFGAYGNPSKLPIGLVRMIANVSRGWTGYFHDWHKMTPGKARKYGYFFMASCEPGNRAQAKRLGLRAFTTRRPGDAVPEGSIDCPSSKGVTCIECGLCAGTSKQAKDISIEVHGYQTKAATNNI